MPSSRWRAGPAPDRYRHDFRLHRGGVSPVWWRVRLAALGVAMATGRFPEFWEYESLSRNLIDGKGFLYFHFGTDYRAYVEPLYPWLVTGVYLIAGDSTVALPWSSV